MPAKRYPVVLDSEQREALRLLIATGTVSARKLTRARILVKADESEMAPLMRINKSEKLLKSPCLPLSEPVKPSHLKVSPPHCPRNNGLGAPGKSLMAKKKHI